MNGSKNPNTKTIYIRDENLLAYNELQSRGGFINWCLQQKELRDKFNELKTEADKEVRI